MRGRFAVRKVPRMKKLVFLVASLTACGWAPNDASTPTSFAADSLTAMTVLPYYDRICGARSDATVTCIDAPTTITDPIPILAPLGETVVHLPNTVTQLAAGGDAVCARLDDASVWCWGVQTPGEPTQIGSGIASVTISVGGLVCLLATSGNLGCTWNEGTAFQGERFPGAGPVDLEGHRAVSVAIGDPSLVVALDDGSIVTWDVTQSMSVPGTRVPIVTNAVAVSAASVFSGGSGEHICALLADATLVCWGGNDNAEVGIGSASGPVGEPARVLDVQGATQVAVGAEHTCVRLEDGTVKCWGASGQFACTKNPRTGDFFSATPQIVPNVARARDLQAGEIVNCALDEKGTISCWGGDHHR
jgi:hypothetical protein